MKNFVKNHILYKCKNKADTDRSQKICQTAFTLAEVLITLGVIGIVAAMTLPSLISYSKTTGKGKSCCIEKVLFSHLTSLRICSFGTWGT